MFLAGRLRAAAARGEAGRSRSTPRSAARRDEFEDALRAGAAGMAEFIDRLAESCAASACGVAVDLERPATAWPRPASRPALEGVFAPDSLIFAGGGAKGVVLPDDWEAR